MASQASPVAMTTVRQVGCCVLSAGTQAAGSTRPFSLPAPAPAPTALHSEVEEGREALGGGQAACEDS